MRYLPRLLLVPFVTLSACHSMTAPRSYNAGTWTSIPIPSGAYTQFSLDTVGGAVRGDGQDFGIASRPQGTFTVAGRESYPSITLTFAYSSGATGTYSAQFVSGSQLLGTWTIPGQPPTGSVSYFRH
jgi:hypothetical protein